MSLATFFTKIRLALTKRPPPPEPLPLFDGNEQVMSLLEYKERTASVRDKAEAKTRRVMQESFTGLAGALKREGEK